MRHKRYLAGTAVLAAVLLTGCTSDAGDGAGDSAGKSGDFPPTPTQKAEPGKYDSLPEPCSAVGQDTLDTMLPGIEELAGEQREKAYAGEAAVTYDTDRRAGCRWSAESSDAAYRLHVDFERVVSYDDAVSDDELAADLFLDKKIAADLPEPGTDEESEEPSGTSDPEDGKGDPDQGEPSSSPSTTAPEGLEPRALDDLADDAYLDDALGAAGSTAPQRLVTVVFRTSNVLVTVEYTAQSASVEETPDSKELQDRARVLAGRLAEQFTE